jgi:hypothetical protein
MMQRENPLSILPDGNKTKLEEVSFAIVTEFMRVLTLRDNPWARSMVATIFRLPVRRMAEKLIGLDENVAAHGWSAAMGLFLQDFVADYRVRGLENVPPSGPLLVICNHPGSYDMPILSTVMGRDDLKVIASDISIVRLLPSIREHFIFISRDVHQSMLTVRTTIRHLKSGGSVLIFPRGEVEPDQDISPGALPDFERWSLSPELFLRKVPQTQILAVFAKGVLSPRWINHPIVRMWKKPARRQKVAEVLQVAQQLAGQKKFSLTPSLTFSSPQTVDDLGTISAPEGDLLKAMIQQVKLLTGAPGETKARING